MVSPARPGRCTIPATASAVASRADIRDGGSPLRMTGLDSLGQHPVADRDRPAGVAATPASCVITTIVKPAAFSWSSSSMSAAAFCESRFPVGSSHSSRLGRFTSARAMATRWHSPPDSVVGSASSRCPSPTASSAPIAAWNRPPRGVWL